MNRPWMTAPDWGARARVPFAMAVTAVAALALNTARAGTVEYKEDPDAQALARQDLAFIAFGEAFPELAPFVSLPYGLGRVVRDIREARKQQSTLLDDAAGGCN